MSAKGFIELAQSLSPALFRLLLQGDVRCLDSYNRATTIVAGASGPVWRRDCKGYYFGQKHGLTADGGALSVADAAELRLTSGTLFWAARSFQAVAADVGARVFSKRDAGGTLLDLYLGAANRLDIYDGTNTRTMTSTALAGSHSGAVRYASGGTPDLFVDGAWRAAASGTITPPSDDAVLYLGNDYTAAKGSHRTEYGCFLAFPSQLTDQNISELHDAWERIGSVFTPKRTISRPRKATDIVATAPLVHLAGERNAAGLLRDLSGNGRNGTVSGRVTQTKSQSRTKQRGHGAGNPLIAAASDTSLYPSSFTLELRYIARSRGESSQGCLWSISDGGTTRSRLFLGAANTWWYEVAYAGATARWTFSAGPYALEHGLVLKHARSLGLAPVVILNGETLVVTEAVAASGALTAAAAPLVSRLNVAALDSDFDGELIDEKQWASLLSDAECRALYLDHALSDVRRLANRADKPVSVANVTAGEAGPWRVVDGTWQWTDTGTRRQLLNVAVGRAAAGSPHAYGMFYQRVKKVSGSADVLFFPIASATTALGGNAYLIHITSGEAVAFYPISSEVIGDVVAILDTGSIALDTEYELAVTRRRRDGLWTFWFRGGQWPVWTKVKTLTDNTHTSSTFYNFRVVTAAGATVSDVLFIPQGDTLEPAEVPGLEESVLDLDLRGDYVGDLTASDRMGWAVDALAAYKIFDVNNDDIAAAAAGVVTPATGPALALTGSPTTGLAGPWVRKGNLAVKGAKLPAGAFLGSTTDYDFASDDIVGAFLWRLSTTTAHTGQGSAFHAFSLLDSTKTYGIAVYSQSPYGCHLWINTKAGTTQLDIPVISGVDTVLISFSISLGGRAAVYCGGVALPDGAAPAGPFAGQLRFGVGAAWDGSSPVLKEMGIYREMCWKGAGIAASIATAAWHKKLAASVLGSLPKVGAAPAFSRVTSRVRYVGTRPHLLGFYTPAAGYPSGAEGVGIGPGEAITAIGTAMNSDLPAAAGAAAFLAAVITPGSDAGIVSTLVDDAANLGDAREWGSVVIRLQNPTAGTLYQRLGNALGSVATSWASIRARVVAGPVRMGWQTAGGALTQIAATIAGASAYDRIKGTAAPAAVTDQQALELPAAADVYIIAQCSGVGARIPDEVPSTDALGAGASVGQDTYTPDLTIDDTAETYDVQLVPSLNGGAAPTSVNEVMVFGLSALAVGATGKLVSQDGTTDLETAGAATLTDGVSAFHRASHGGAAKYVGERAGQEASGLYDGDLPDPLSIVGGPWAMAIKVFRSYIASKP